MRSVVIRSGKEKLLRRRHPWVLPRAIARVDESDAGRAETPGASGVDVTPDDLVRVVDSAGAFIAWGWYAPQAHTPIRLVSWEETTPPDDGWLDSTLRAAVARRDAIGVGARGGRRLVFGEADGLPGFAIDQYGDFIVVQLSAAPAIARAERVVAILSELLAPAGVRLVTDRTQRLLDDLPEIDRWIGAEPDGAVEIEEGAARFAVDLRSGQKTGFYLDQRESRAALRPIAAGRRVLDAFSYSGGFACSFDEAARVHCIDSSEAAGALVAENARRNARDQVTFERADVFAWLRAQSASSTPPEFDLIVLDPPKMARGRREKERAMRGYKDLVLHALALTSINGLIALFSCAATINGDDLLTASAWAALDAGRALRVVARFSQAADHPILTSFPESAYLSGLLLQSD